MPSMIEEGAGGVTSMTAPETRAGGYFQEKEHTSCFICARTYFWQIVRQCPRCRSRSVQHYTSDELNLMGHG
ncbi:MAG: hypothetical protein KGM47_06975 [Acidobacteriota bacterium]|nr:hypothetical protein [Acidobacteriota bacterium]